MTSWQDIKNAGVKALPYAGAAAGGMVGGPVGAAAGYGAGSVVGGLINPDPNGTSASEAAKVQSFANAQGKYANYRGQMAGERNQALQNQLAAYQGAQGALTSMYGGAPAQSFNPAQVQTFRKPQLSPADVAAMQATLASSRAAAPAPVQQRPGAQSFNPAQVRTAVAAPIRSPNFSSFRR